MPSTLRTEYIGVEVEPHLVLGAHGKIVDGDRFPVRQFWHKPNRTGSQHARRYGDKGGAPREAPFVRLDGYATAGPIDLRDTRVEQHRHIGAP